MKQIINEGINQPQKFTEKSLSRAEIDEALTFVLKRIDETMEEFTYKFPASSSTNNIYPGVDNNEWTCSFYTGMLWLAYEVTGDEKYKKVAEIHTNSFEERLETGDVDTHDLGFLYSLSCVAQYKLTGDERAKQIAIKAAQLLMNRWKEKGSFIQAWGDINDKKNYRFIIDCLMNLPLLFWVGETTGDKLYIERAHKHLITTLENIVREDSSTYHTFFMNPETGEPHHGETHQGYSDTSCWARGQAWAMYGLPLSYSYIKEPIAIEVCEKLTNYYLNRLPEDFFPY